MLVATVVTLLATCSLVKLVRRINFVIANFLSIKLSSKIELHPQSC